MTTLSELKKLAEAALVIDHNENADWYSVDDLVVGHGVGYMKNARFIAAANPQQVLKMIECMEVMADALGVTTTCPAIQTTEHQKP